jgi:hypothetical protein
MVSVQFYPKCWVTFDELNLFPYLRIVGSLDLYSRIQILICLSDKIIWQNQGLANCSPWTHCGLLSGLYHCFSTIWCIFLHAFFILWEKSPYLCLNTCRRSHILTFHFPVVNSNHMWEVWISKAGTTPVPVNWISSLVLRFKKLKLLLILWRTS